MAAIELPDAEELEERKDKNFTRRVALLTAIYAVVLAVTSLGGSNATKDMMLAQQEAADQWAFYQAKSIRGHQVHLERIRLDLELAEHGSNIEPGVQTKYE